MTNEEDLEKRQKALDTLHELGKVFQEGMEKIKNEQEEYWNTFTKEQQLDLFCCVVRRIVQGELTEQGSYRHVLYDTFGFGMESYTLALDAGYMSLHNSIFCIEEEARIINEETEQCAKICEQEPTLTGTLLAERIRQRKSPDG